MNYSNKRHQGFTLIEFLLGMALTTVIFIIATNLVVSFLSVNVRSQQSESIEQAKRDIAAELTNVLAWSEELTFTDGILTVDGNDYKVENGLFLKNGSAFTKSDVIISDFSVITSPPDYQVTLNFTHKQSKNIKDELKLTISSRLN